MNREIHVNFLPFIDQNFGIVVYRKRFAGGEHLESASYYNLPDSNGETEKYEIVEEEAEGYEEYTLPPYLKSGIIAKRIFQSFKDKLDFFEPGDSDGFNTKLFKVVERHPKGRQCIWIEPHYFKSKELWGINIGQRFLPDENLRVDGRIKVDKDILIASGSLNSKGLVNFDFYLFKHHWIELFIKSILPTLNAVLPNKLSNSLLKLGSATLKSKQYVFRDGITANSAYIGLTQNNPLEGISEDLNFLFLYTKEDRAYAATLLKGLRGESFPNTFAGFSKVFKAPFGNDRIKGVSLDFSDESIDEQIRLIKESSTLVIPIIVVASRGDGESEVLYYRLKHKFTNAGIPCQVVTKELISNESSLKFSLSNIGLQIFAKAGGKPWKMRPESSDTLIIGIGQSYNIETSEVGTSVQKNVTYSVLTDSSGIFKDIRVLSEGVVSDAYYEKLVANISNLILESKHRKVTIHSPFRISKEKILKNVKKNIGSDVELTVLVINTHTDHFGFDYLNNGLVPFESTFVRIGGSEYLVWFEGLSYQNPKITKRFANPLSIIFWDTTNKELMSDRNLKENLLQDCINLSGANWRGFRSKQLPVSIFYCQRIAEFIGKFREYEMAHFEINNLKPWFL